MRFRTVIRSTMKRPFRVLPQICVNSRRSKVSVLSTPLFDCFLGTIGLFDFPRSFIAVVLPWDLLRGPCCHPIKAEHGISRFPLEKLPCVRGVYDHAEPKHLLRLPCASCCLPYTLTPSTPRTTPSFAAQYPARIIPCQRFAHLLTDMHA